MTVALLAIAGVRPDAIAEDYLRGAEQAPPGEHGLDEFLAERGTSARQLVLDVADRIQLERPGLRARLVV